MNAFLREKRKDGRLAPGYAAYLLGEGFWRLARLSCCIGVFPQTPA